MTSPAREVNFDGLVGPTHNYAGLSYGNIASVQHGDTTSNPKQAALEGLAKMKLLADMGLAQAVLPPQERPDLPALRRLGFHGSDASILEQAHRDNPALLASVSSASCMWTANAATVSPSADTADGRIHFTVANLISQPHRSIEPPATHATLLKIFRDDECFAHHGPLPSGAHLGDEGAANHTRLCDDYGQPGVELFAYGRAALDASATQPTHYPARQTHEASAAVARLHRLDPDRTIVAQQNPAVIDAGVFHNDVISVGNRNVFLYHHEAFVDTPTVIEELKRTYARACGNDLVCIGVASDQVAVAEAVATYLFNSQLVSLPDGGMSLICPAQCQEHDRTRQLLERITAGDNPINTVHYVDVRQSMCNGGGPACLRLRVVLTGEQIERSLQGVYLTDDLYNRLTSWVTRHYRDQLSPPDLADPKLLDESRTALEELTRILGLGSLYPFQRAGAGAR